MQFSIYCTASSVLALTHPAVGQNFPTHHAGRAIAFFNLLLFLGVFFAQWGVGQIVAVVGVSEGNLVIAYQVAFFILAALSLLSYLLFLLFDRIFKEGQNNLEGELAKKIKGQV